MPVHMCEACLLIFKENHSGLPPDEKYLNYYCVHQYEKVKAFYLSKRNNKK